MCEVCEKPIRVRRSSDYEYGFYKIYQSYLIIMDDYNHKDFSFIVNYCPNCGREL